MLRALAEIARILAQVVYHVLTREKEVHVGPVVTCAGRQKSAHHMAFSKIEGSEQTR